MTRVAISCARWLGIMCLRELTRHDVEIVGVHAPTGPHWWTDIDDAAEVKRLGLKRTGPEFFNAAACQADLVFSILSDHIFRPHEIPTLGAINLHPAPLPEYRGCNSYAHAIINGDQYYAATLHYIDEGIDTGPIIGQEWLPIDDHETGISLYRKGQCAALALFKRELPAILANADYGAKVPAVPQDETRARYYRRDSLADKSLSGLTLEQADRKRRALNFPPFPPAVEAGLSEEGHRLISAYAHTA